MCGLADRSTGNRQAQSLPHITAQRIEQWHAPDAKIPPSRIDWWRSHPPVLFELLNPVAVFFGCIDTLPELGGLVNISSKPAHFIQA